MSDTPASKPKQAIGSQFVRFLIVGAIATSAHYTVLIVLREVFGVDPVIGTVIGYATGTIVSYLLNRRFTFETRPAFGRGLAKFVLVNVVGAGLNAMIVWLATSVGAHYMVGQVIATGLVFVFNFAAARYFVFRA
ncbi:hypothetical protein U91I_02321 [alpha proteobacterium U9-1i]|nr:hypothetical protein U91I_02321 [alpha proteobacterium U9-1i]